MFELSVLAAKTAIVMLFLFIAFRLLGKRNVGQMNLYDLAMIMALANAVKNAMTAGKGNLAVGIVSSGTLLAIGWAASRFFIRSPKTESLLLGSPAVLLTDGKILKDRLVAERISKDELMTAMRMHGITDPKKVALAVLEVDGSISIVPKEGDS